MPKRKGELTQQELAAAIGISQPRISKIISDGILDKSIRKEGRRTYINFKKAQDELSRNLDMGRVTKANVPGIDNAKSIPGPEPDQFGVMNNTGIDINRAKALAVYFQAALRKQQYESLQGKWLQKDRVERDIFSITRKARDTLQNIPARLAHVLTDEQKEELTKEISQTLKDLANDLDRMI